MADIDSDVTSEQSRETADHLGRAIHGSRRDDDGDSPASPDDGLWR